MFVLIWVFLSLLLVTCSHANTEALRQYCTGDFCVSLNKATITAEAGLCVIIPCSFRLTYFTPVEMVWFKCGSWRTRCEPSDTIFHSDKDNTDVQTGYRGRVSLLEPDVTQRNCSIIINDLTESDSGSYQFRVAGYNFYRRRDGYSFPQKVTLRVTALTQRPTLTVPPLMAGQQSTLMCTAPGLCSGSHPRITWSWRENRESMSYTTADQTETLSGVTKRYSSALTLNASADTHGNTVTCQVSFRDDLQAEESAVLNVTYVKEVRITGNTSVEEGHTLNLTCSVDSFPPSVVTWTRLLDRNETNAAESSLENSRMWNVASLRQQGGSDASIFNIANVSAADSGQYVCIVKYMNTTLEKITDVRVNYWRTPVISNSTSVEEGDALNLTCSVDSFPPSVITWTRLLDRNETNATESSKKNSRMWNGASLRQQGGSDASIFSFANVSAADSGQYVCTVKYMNTTLEKITDVRVNYRRTPVISGSTSVEEGDALKLTCSVDSFPPSSVMWTKSGSVAPFQNHEGSATLFFSNATARHSGCYICTAQRLDTIVMVSAHVTVARSPKILPTSQCTVRSDVLTCVCMSQGSPVPTVKWPILRNLTDYSVTTSVSGDTVNSTLVLAAQDIAKVQCNSGKLKKLLSISAAVDDPSKVLNIPWLQVIIAFLLGVLLSALICGLLILCCRKKQRSFGHFDDTMEMVTDQEDPLMKPTLLLEDIHGERAGGGTRGEGKAAVLPQNGEPKEVEYARIDFAALKNRPRRSVKVRETAETEYAEVKREKKDTTAASSPVEADAKEAQEAQEQEQEEEEEKETVGHEAGEEGREDESVYSTVKDALEEM